MGDKTPSSKLKIRTGIQVLYSWEAPERIWYPKTKQWYLTYALIILVAILFAVRMEYYVIVLGLVAFMGLWFIQGTLPPWVVTHQITSKGVYTFNSLIRWEQISSFWFATKNEQHILYLDFARADKQPRLTLLIPAAARGEIFDLLVAHLTYADLQTAEYTFISPFIYGRYVPLSDLVPDLDQPKV